MPIVTTKQPIDEKPTSIRLPMVMINELQEIQRETGNSRTEVILQLLRYALDAHRKEGKGKK